MMENLCTSTLTRASEGDATTYTCTRQAGHPGVHRSNTTEQIELCTPYAGRRTGATIEIPVQWTDWESFLAVQRIGTDAQVVAAGAALVTHLEWYGDMLSRQSRYAALTAAQ